MTDRIVCAAIRMHFYHSYGEEQLVVCCVRHGGEGLYHVIDSLNDRMKLAHKEHEDEQGFVNQRGEFLNRFEALLVAAVAGQLIKKTMPADRLFSEDLY